MINVNNEQQEQATATNNTFNIKVIRASAYKENAFVFDMIVNGVYIYGCWYKQGKSKNGNDYSFIDFPSMKGKNGKYYNHAWFSVSNDIKAEIEKQIEGLLGG